MALVVKDRIKETSSTTGQGTLTLGGAVDGFRTFADIGDGNTTYYAIVDGNNFEVGLGTYTASGTTLSRDTVFQTSAGNTTKISCTGDQEVFVTQPADKAVFEDASGVANAIGFRGNIHPNNGATTNYLSLKDSNELNFFNSSNSSIKLYINYDGGDVDIAQSAIVATNGGATKVTNNLLVGTDVGSYNSNDFNVFVSNADQGTTLCLYDDSGAYHSGLITYDTNILSLGLNNANSANTLLTSSAINIGSDGVGIGITPGSARGGYTDLLIAQGGETNAQPQIELYNSSASWAINNDALNSNQMGFHYNNGSSWSQILALKPSGTVSEFSGDIQAAGVYVGSANTSYDFYNNGTSYLNGTVTVDERLTAQAISLNDNGVSGVILEVRTDDDGPWAMRVGNDTVGTSAGYAMYQHSNGTINHYSYGNGAYVNTLFHTSDGSGNVTYMTVDTNGSVNITPGTGHGSNDASLWVNGPNANDWGCVINKASGDYGLDIRGTSGSYALRITDGSERFRITWGGTIYVNGSSGSTGQFLSSNGGSSAASWVDGASAGKALAYGLMF